MEHDSSYEAISDWAIQYMARLLWNLKFYYRFHKRSPLVPILNQMNSVQIYPPYFLKIYSNIIVPSMSRSSELSFPSDFPIIILYSFPISGTF
jgi:hypothetical protein